MGNFRNELNSQERLARSVVGINTDAKFTVNENSADDLLKREKIARFNDQVDAMEQKLELYMNNVEQQSMDIAQQLNGVDIVPLFNYVLIKPFTHNPFQKMKVDDKSGLIIDAGGLAPEYKNQENGEIEEEQELIKVGMVVETGHTCQFLKAGDLVFYNDMASAVNVPFYKIGLVAVNEQRIIAVVNNDLTARKQAIQNK